MVIIIDLAQISAEKHGDSLLFPVVVVVASLLRDEQALFLCLARRA